jgi:NADH-quinone oxidoreductase subunit H
MSRGLGVTIAILGLLGVFYGFAGLNYWVAGHAAAALNNSVNLLPQVTVALVNLVFLMLVGVMIFASLLTLAERKWSAMMQDRVGPNRARLSAIPGLGNLTLAGLPHFMADGLKMLTKEGFRPAAAARLLFELAPIMNFAPVFCLFAIVPTGPVINVAGVDVGLQVANPDFGVLYIFALASIAVYGTALAGWASNNKFALLGGVRATSQMISYEVALGMSLVGMMMVANSLRLNDMMLPASAMENGGYLWRTAGEFDFGLPAWGIFLQPIGFILFFTAAFAETKRAPFDLPEGESEVIGYFVEYSGMGFGLFMITEFVEVVVLSGVTTAVFFGGYHFPFGEQWLIAHLGKWVYPLMAMMFWLKVLVLCYVQLAVRWSFPRFRYDQIQRLGWQMLLPAGLINVFLTGALILWDESLHALAWVGLLELIAIGMLIPGAEPAPERPNTVSLHGSGAGAGHGGH